MNEREILAQRELVSSYLLDNLHKYGNIEPPGFYGRPMRGFGEYVSLTAKVNYLRVSAWLTESSPKSPNFLTESQVKALNAVIKSDAVPVYMEYWTGNKQVGYNVRLKPSYNVMDVTCYNPMVQTLQQNQPAHDTDADREALIKFIDPHEVADGLEYDADGNPLDSKAEDFYFRLIKSAAKVSGLDEPSAKLFTQLVFKTYRVSMPLKEGERLFSEEEIAAFEQNSGSIFKASNAAFTLLKDYDSSKTMAKLYARQDLEAEKRAADAMWQAENGAVQATPQAAPQTIEPAEAEDVENKETLIEGKTDAFKGLRIHYEFIDATLCDDDGKPYPYKNTTLTGEKAYEFLVAMNKMDKEMFYAKGVKEGDGKCCLSISYRDFEYNNGKIFRLDLGNLELGNRKSIAKALEHRLTSYSRQILMDEELQNELSMENYGKDADTKVMPEELRQSVNKNLAEIKTAMEAFAVEENAYLAQHPELKAENEADAHPFVYMCRKEDFNKFFDQCVEPLQPETIHDFCVFPTSFKMGTLARPFASYEEQEYANYLKIRKNVPDGFVVFSSNWSPDGMEEELGNEGKRLLTLVPEKTVQDLRDMSKLSITVTTRDAYERDAASDKSKDVYYGSIAIMELNDLVNSDLDYVEQAMRDNLYIPRDTITDVQLAFDDRPITTVSGRIGDGTFAMRLSGENFLGSPDERIPKVRELFYLYNHLENDGWPNDLQYKIENEDRDFIEKGGVSPEKSQKTWLEHVSDHEPEPKKGSVSHAYLQDCVKAYFDRYGKIAMASKENATREDVLKAGARRMLEAGHTLGRIKQIGKYLQGKIKYGKSFQNDKKNGDFICRYADSAEMMSLERQVKAKANSK